MSAGVILQNRAIFAAEIKLREFFRETCVPVTNERHCELTEKELMADKLGLPVRRSDEEAERSIHQAKERKLVLDGRITNLPETLASGWVDGPGKWQPSRYNPELNRQLC